MPKTRKSRISLWAILACFLFVGLFWCVLFLKTPCTEPIHTSEIALAALAMQIRQHGRRAAERLDTGQLHWLYNSLHTRDRLLKPHDRGLDLERYVFIAFLKPFSLSASWCLSLSHKKEHCRTVHGCPWVPEVSPPAKPIIYCCCHQLLVSSTRARLSQYHRSNSTPETVQQY